MTNNTPCPCGMQEAGIPKTYEACCQRFVSGAEKPEHCELLMRSRYSAYALGQVDYLIQTWHPAKQSALSREELLQSAQSTHWLRLEVVSSSQQGEQGTVEFNAFFRDQEATSQEVSCLHEVSRFEKIADQWFYLDGDVDSVRQAKVGRNDPCPCGSGKKYKKCCG